MEDDALIAWGISPEFYALCRQAADESIAYWIEHYGKGDPYRLWLRRRVRRALGRGLSMGRWCR